MALNTNKYNKKCRVFLIPHLSKGHLIPMTDFAKLLAAAHPDVEPTIIVTPGNAALIDKSLGQVQILTYPFPSEGPKTSVETVGLGSKEESLMINKKSWLIRPAVEELISNYKPDAVVSDALFSWAPSAAAEYGIPCILFFCSGIFPLVIYRHIFEMKPNMGFDDNVTVSDLPGPKIVMPVRELPNYPLGQDEGSNQILDSMFGSWPNTFGIVFNTFRALESEYCKEFERAQTKRAYFIGPVSSSYNSTGAVTIHRGGEGDTGCLSWLDSKEDGSVVFVSFGSQCYFKSEQLHELAIGLENSKRNFLWAVRGDNMEEWMPDGWEDRIAGRGIVVKGWAPQVAILAHPATGAFMTHCGWNSILEGTSAGVPMLTWPFAAEEFISERLLVEVIGCASRVWDGKRSTREVDNELVPGSAIARAVSKFMEHGEEYEKIRSHAQHMATLALAAVQEGGSSSGDIRSLVNDLIGLVVSK
ncbi:putative UDP-glucosyl transferase 73B6 [Carex rostrata]